MTECSILLKDEAATVAAGKQLAQILFSGECSPPGSDFKNRVIYLQGRLGAGKTTFCRGFLQALGHEGAVKSPTYTLVEPYELTRGAVYHFDLYRLRDPAELEYLGLEEYFQPGKCCLVEWPEKGVDAIPAANILVSLQTEGDGRRLLLSGFGESGKNTVEAFYRIVK